MIKRILSLLIFFVCSIHGFSDIPLFRVYPNLAGVLPHIHLGTFPTPVVRVQELENEYGLYATYLKMDGLSGGITQEKTLFGGNKVRKLEFLLADALHQGATTVITQGGVGSNHALCTAIYANQLGLKAILNLKPQPNSHGVRRNLLRDLEVGAQIYTYPNKAVCNAGILAISKECTKRDGKEPYVIPTGGSCPRGIVGFVNAAFELKEQIQGGLVPEPDRIYVSLGIGSSGTAAGLLIGIKAAGLKSKLIAIGVEPEVFPGEAEQGLLKLVEDTITFLHDLDPSFPGVKVTQEDYEVVTKFGGGGYGLFSTEGMEAKKVLHQCQGITLDGTYTAKAFAGFLDDCHEHKQKVLLFWNTFDGTMHNSNVDYKELPLELHCYFENDVQELDK